MRRPASDTATNTRKPITVTSTGRTATPGGSRGASAWGASPAIGGSPPAMRVAAGEPEREDGERNEHDHGRNERAGAKGGREQPEDVQPNPQEDQPADDAQGAPASPHARGQQKREGEGDAERQGGCDGPGPAVRAAA